MPNFNSVKYLKKLDAKLPELKQKENILYQFQSLEKMYNDYVGVFVNFDISLRVSILDILSTKMKTPQPKSCY